MNDSTRATVQANEHLATLLNFTVEYWAQFGPDEHWKEARRAIFALADAQPTPVDVLEAIDILVNNCDWDWIGNGIHRKSAHTVRTWLSTQRFAPVPVPEAVQQPGEKLARLWREWLAQRPAQEPPAP